MRSVFRLVLRRGDAAPWAALRRELFSAHLSWPPCGGHGAASRNPRLHETSVCARENPTKIHARCATPHGGADNSCRKNGSPRQPCIRAKGRDTQGEGVDGR